MPDSPRLAHPQPGPAVEPRRVRSSGGVTIALHDLGASGDAATAAPLLVVHANGFHGLVWSPCARHLPFRCWAPDLRGHGASPLPPGAFSGDEPDGELLRWERFADDVLAVVDEVREIEEMDPREAMLAAGHSMGGAALVLAEQRRPGTFAALYLYEPVIIPDVVPEAAPVPIAESARRRRPSFPSRDAALAHYAAKPPLDILDPEALDAYVRHGFTDRADGSVWLACPPAVEAATFRQGVFHRAFDHLCEVRCPVTVACGGPPPARPAGPGQAAPAIAEALPRSELVMHGELGHFGPLEDPAAIAADITARLRR